MSVKVEHYENGQIQSIKSINEEGQYHNPNGPAIQRWFENGQEECREYWIDGKYHDPHGPTYQEWYKNGQEKCREYRVEGRLHNSEGPALQIWHENGQEKCREYWFNGERHNPNGPARQEWYDNGREMYREYRLKGVRLTKKEFNQYHNTIEVTCNGKSVRINKSLDLDGLLNSKNFI